ncbi:hypothetical protein DFP73DRAFT_567249 [Morchella snyderi]|nr:hypothetical protein DFP73DRAFT_567249 [Morchella snyderi]
MTHISDIAAVLLRGVDVLNDQMSSGQPAPLSDDDRRHMMRHLMVTVETAAKLADVAHVEALAASQQNASAANVERTRANPELLKDMAENRRTAVERAALDTGGEGMVGRIGTESVLPQFGRFVAERERRSAEKEKTEKDVAGVLQDTEKIKTELDTFGNDLQRTVQGMEALKEEMKKVRSERLKAEEDTHSSSQDREKMNAQMERFGLDVERTVKEMEVLRVELEKMRSERRKVEEDVQRALTETDNLWVGLYQL